MLTKAEFNLLSAYACSKGQSADSESAAYITLCNKGFIIDDKITAAGIEALEPHRVKRAVFFAAGFGVRMAPVTYDLPKPLVKVNGRRIIDTLLDAVTAVGIEEITIVRGYKSECFDDLKEKYPSIEFIENTHYDSANNILSAYLAGERLKNAYVFESDLFLNNPGLLTRYQYESNYLGVPVSHTDDWCFTADENLRITSLKRGGDNCFHMFGISYICESDGIRIAADIKKLYDNDPDSRQHFWDDAALLYNVKDYDIKVRPCTFDDVSEIDTLDELIEIDSSYSKYKNRK